MDESSTCITMSPRMPVYFPQIDLIQFERLRIIIIVSSQALEKITGLTHQDMG